MINKVSIRVFSTIIIIIFFIGELASQTAEISLSPVVGCQGNTLEIPVVATDLVDVGAITLFIDYNKESLVFDTLTAVNNNLSGLIYNDIELPQGITPSGKIGISWSGFNPVSFSGDELFVLSFTFLGQNDSLVFSSDNEIADFDANIMPVNYVNSTISLSEEVSITQQAENLSIYDDESGSFSVEGINISGYNWEYYMDNQWIAVPDNNIFSGQDTNTLSICSPDLTLDGVFFRCNVEGCNSMYSDSVQLFIQPHLIKNIAKAESIKVFPNPAQGFVIIDVSSINNGSYKLSIQNLMSETYSVVYERINGNNRTNITIDTQDIAPGVYFIVISGLGNNKGYQERKKIIIVK